MRAGQTHVGRGVLLVVAAAMLWGTTGTVQSFSSGAIAPVWVGSLRMVFAALFFWIALAFAGRARAGEPIPDPPGGRAWFALLAAGLSMAVYNLAFFAGVKAVGVGIGTAVAIGSGPLWAGLLQALLTRRAPGGGWWLGTFASVTGAVLLLADGGDGRTPSPIGIVLCLTAGAAYAVYALVNKALVTTAGPLAVTARVFSIAALVSAPAAAAHTGLPAIAAPDLALVVYLGVFATGIAYWLFASGQRHLSGPSAVTLALAEPLTAFVLAVVLLDEALGPIALVGMTLLIAGLAIVVRGERVRA
ncbi:MAG: EamA family transporter [Burkholderiaceae bacterium]